MNKFEIIPRPVLPDRIQINVTPNYPEVFDTQNNKVKDQYKYLIKSIINNAKLQNLASKRFSDKRNKPHYNIDLISNYPYISNIKLNAFCPFSISFKINFIRFLNEKIKEQNEFNSKYFNDILLDDDNFLDTNIWFKWNNNLVDYLINSLNDNCLKLAKDLLYSIVPYNNIEYQTVTISQIEPNIDYYVGCDNSLNMINLFSDFINSDTCIDFRKKIGEIALRHKIPFELNDKYNKINKNESISIQFQICEAFFVHIYRKTRDHIRFELLFEKHYLKTKFKKIVNDRSSSTNIKRIVKPIIEFSKDFFKEVDFPYTLKLLYHSSNNYYEIDHSSKSIDFYRQVDPVHNDIRSCIDNNMPITDKNTISFISKHPDYSKRFERHYLNNGKKYFIYNPNNLKNYKGKKLKPPIKPKPKYKPINLKYPPEIKWINNESYVKIKDLTTIL